MGDVVGGMKKCPQCAEEIKVEAVKCRYCSSDLSGGPIRPSVQPPQPPPVVNVKVQGAQGGAMRLVRNLISLMVFGILATVVGTCVICGKAAKHVADESEKRSEADRTAVATATAIDITANELEAAYATNEVGADNQYKDKVLRVGGVVESIRKDILDDPHVVLRSNRPLGGVTCSFGKGSDGPIGSLSPGQRVVLRGVGDGYMLGSPRLRGCVIGTNEARETTQGDASIAAGIAKATEFKNAFCKCRDRACVQRLTDEMNNWSEEMNKTRHERRELTEQEKTTLGKVEDEMNACKERATVGSQPARPKRASNGVTTRALKSPQEDSGPNDAPEIASESPQPTASSPQPPAASPQPPAASPQPPAVRAQPPADCSKYSAAVERLQHCDGLLKEERAALKKVHDGAMTSWRSLSTAAQAGACKVRHDHLPRCPSVQ